MVVVIVSVLVRTSIVVNSTFMCCIEIEKQKKNIPEIRLNTFSRIDRSREHYVCVSHIILYLESPHNHNSCDSFIVSRITFRTFSSYFCVSFESNNVMNDRGVYSPSDKTSYASEISRKRRLASSKLLGFLSGCHLSANFLYAFLISTSLATFVTSNIL